MAKEEYTLQEDKDSIRVFFDKDATSHKNLSSVSKRIFGLNLESYIKPTKIVTDELDVLESYEIEKLGKSRITKFTRLPKKDLVESLRAIRRDLLKISSGGLLISNLDLKNIRVLENKIFLVGISNLEANMDRSYVTLSNNVLMNDFFGSTGVVKESRGSDSMIVYNHIYGKFMSSSEERIEDFYDKTLQDESIHSYIKRYRKEMK